MFAATENLLRGEIAVTPRARTCLLLGAVGSALANTSRGRSHGAWLKSASISQTRS